MNDMLTLFQGKCADNNNWVIGYYCPACFGQFPCRPAIIPKVDLDDGYWHPIEIVPETLGQFTGKFDATAWDDLPEPAKDAWLKGNTAENWRGRPIFLNSVVREGCNLLTSHVVYDVYLGRCKLDGLGKDYTIQDSHIEWRVVGVRDGKGYALLSPEYEKVTEDFGVITGKSHENARYSK